MECKTSAETRTELSRLTLLKLIGSFSSLKMPVMMNLCPSKVKVSPTGSVVPKSCSDSPRPMTAPGVSPAFDR